MPAVAAANNGASSFLSANHPLNLRKQAQPKLDSSFSVKTYIGAANALLDKARASDAQGQIEVAFVNYLKAANVAAFISKHDDWPKIQKARGSVYQAYNELMKQAPAFIERTKRLESQLAVREERNAQQLAQAAEEQAQNAARQRQAQPPGDSALRDPGSRPVHGSDEEDHATDASPIDQHAEGRRTGSSLADRLRALRNSASTDPAELRDRSQSNASTSDADTDTDSAFATHSLHHALDEASNAFPAIPTASEFNAHYPSIDQLENDDAAGGGFPAPPSHPVGKSKRPLPAPPSTSSNDLAREFALARDVPEPFDRANSAPTPPQPPSRQPRAIDGLPPHDPHRIGLHQAPSSPAPAPAPASTAEPRSLIVGAKPPLPMKNHISVEELFGFLHPGFQEFTDAQGNRKIGKKVGLDVLLLDVRSRADFDAGRILGGKLVCIEPITLRDGMSAAEIEDKLVLSPHEEQAAFAARNTFDLVVLYDRNLRALRGTHSPDKIPQDPAAQARMDTLIRAIYENEFAKTLKHQPVLLVGGFERWAQKAGDKLVLRSAAANGHAHRSSISFEPGTRFPTADDPATRGATAEQLAQQQELKRTRRQQQVVVDPARSMQPGGVYPSRTSNGASSPFSIEGGFGGPSLPARAYKAPGGIASGAPSFPPPAAHRSLSRSNSATAFDYPQLKPSVSGGMSAYGGMTPQPPPMAASSSSPSGAVAASTRDRPTSVPTALIPGTGSAGGNDPSKKQVMAPGYAGHLSTASRVYASPTNGRNFDEIKIGLTGLKNLATRAT